MTALRRKAFNTVLKTLLGSDNVYFQPPDSITMQYPCIVYERDDISQQHADNLPYRSTRRYQVTYISHDPDSAVIDALEAMPMSSFSRHFATSGLNHDVFTIHY